MDPVACTVSTLKGIWALYNFVIAFKKSGKEVTALPSTVRDLRIRLRWLRDARSGLRLLTGVDRDLQLTLSLEKEVWGKLAELDNEVLRNLKNFKVKDSDGFTKHAVTKVRWMSSLKSEVKTLSDEMRFHFVRIEAQINHINSNYNIGWFDESEIRQPSPEEARRVVYELMG